MMEPEKVPEKIRAKISKEAIIVMIGLGILFQLLNVYVIKQVDDELDVIEISVTITYVVAAIMSFFVSRQYGWKTHVFGKSYLSLALGYMMYVAAELIWHYYEVVLKTSPYPSEADVFYFAFYPFAIYHLITNSKFFKPKFTSIEKIWVGAIPISIFGIYAYLAFLQTQDLNFDFYYGSIFVAATSITLSFAIRGATIFRQSVLGAVWLLLVLGIFLNTFADVWYYYLEIFGLYEREHITMALWITSSFFIIYALYKHRESI